MKKSMSCVIIGIVGLGAGIGAGFLINKPKLDQSKAAYTELQTKMQEAEKNSAQQLDLVKADNARISTENKRVNTELTRYKSEYIRANTELARVSTEFNKLKESILPQAEVSEQAASATPAAAAPGAATAQPASATSAPAKAVVAAGEYVIKDGDNLWKIAADQLGSGIRFKEIIAVNPGITEKTTLEVGSKIKLPAK